DVFEGRTMLRQQPLDLVPGVAALRSHIAKMADDAALAAVFIFRADAAEINGLASVLHRNDFREAPFCPFGIVVILFFKAAAVLRLGLRAREGHQERKSR